MPRHKATPKKHENDPSTSIANISLSVEQQNHTTDDDEEVLDLSTKRRKSTDNGNNCTDNTPRCPKKSTDFVYKEPPHTLTLPIHPHPFGFSSIFAQLQQTFPTSSTDVGNVSTAYKNVLCQSVSQNDALSKLSNLVSKVGKSQTSPTNRGIVGNAIQEAVIGGANNGLNFQELWWRFVKKEENAEMKRLNEAKQIFTCLQCQASFQTMDQLVKHMENTQHYANIPKHYSWSLQYARQKMRQMKMKMKYSDKMMYFCFLCQNPFTEPVHVHFNCVHSMHNPAENMKFVQIISVGAESSCSSSSTSKNNHNHNNHKRKISMVSPCDTSTTYSSDCSSPLPQSSTPFSNSSDAGSPEKVMITSNSDVNVNSKKYENLKKDGEECHDFLFRNASQNLLSKMEELVQNAINEQRFTS